MHRVFKKYRNFVAVYILGLLQNFLSTRVRRHKHCGRKKKGKSCDSLQLSFANIFELKFLYLFGRYGSLVLDILITNGNKVDIPQQKKKGVSCFLGPQKGLFTTTPSSIFFSLQNKKLKIREILVNFYNHFLIFFSCAGNVRGTIIDIILFFSVREFG